MKKINEIIKDEYYKKTGNNSRLRIAVRALLENNEHKFAFIHIKGHDDFGNRDHLETPGGGVDQGEGLQEALIRELDEELGAQVKIINEVGYIDIEYNLLNRIDRENYFCCKLENLNHKSHLLDYEKTLFDKIIWLSYDELIDMLTNYPEVLVGKMIHKREKIVFEYAKEHKII